MNAQITYMPLTEEIRLETFGSPDFSGFPGNFLSDGHSVYSRGTRLKFWGLPRKRVGYVRELP